MKPTQHQINTIVEMCQILGLEFPKGINKVQAEKWIRDHRDEYISVCENLYNDYFM